MDTETINRLVKQARNDPEFFHALVFDPEKVFSQVDYLNHNAKSLLQTIKPEYLISATVTTIFSASCDANTTCSCTSGTCGGPTCGGSTCDVTCSGDSCGSTCGNSCGYTSNFENLNRFDLSTRLRNLKRFR